MRDKAYTNNQDILNFNRSIDLEYTTLGIPIVQPLKEIEDNIETLPFNYAMTSKNYNNYIHFYIQDYMFERIWNAPDKYVDILKRFKGVIQPDFSLYLDMPYPMQLWNYYRNMWLASYYQHNDIKVIPSAIWSDDASYKYCFNGMPKESVICVSSIGCINQGSKEYFYNGLKEMMGQLEPIHIFLRSSVKEKYTIEDYIYKLDNNIKVTHIDYVI